MNLYDVLGLMNSLWTGSSVHLDLDDSTSEFPEAVSTSCPSCVPNVREDKQLPVRGMCTQRAMIINN